MEKIKAMQGINAARRIIDNITVITTIPILSSLYFTFVLVSLFSLTRLWYYLKSPAASPQVSVTW